MKWFFLFILLFYSNVLTQTATFVKDINLRTDGSHPFNLTNVNDDLFFLTYYINTEYLWLMDGTTKDIQMLYEFDNHRDFFYDLAYNDQYVFSLTDYSSGGQLWKAGKDGTVSKFADIGVDRSTVFNNSIYIISDNKLFKSDANDTELIYTFDDQPLYMVAASNCLYVVLAIGPPASLWKTDGTTENTTKIVSFDNRTIYPVIASQEDKIYFFADSSNTTQFWRSDGSEEGTIQLASFKKFPDGSRYIQSSAGNIYFTPYTDENGRELWVTDGSMENTEMIIDIDEGANSSWPEHLSDVSGTLFFVANRNQLWKSNGTKETTTKIIQLQNDYNNPVNNVFVVNNNFYFDGYTEENGRELWMSDGTPEGTKMIKDIEPGARSSAPSDFCAIGDEIFFNAFSLEYGSELWTSNGTLPGTNIVKDIQSKTSDSNPKGFTTFENSVYFCAIDKSGYNIFKTDISTLETEKIIFEQSDYVKEYDLRTAGNNIYFIGGIDFNDKELWTIDGLSGDVSYLKTLNVRSMITYKDTLFFTTADSNYVAELWKSDGSQEGTIRIKQIYPDDNGYIDYLFVNGDLLYFIYPNEKEIWRSDGTADGTYAIAIDETPAYQFGALNIAKKMYFRGDHSLWVTDGTIEGTVKLFDEDSGYYLGSMANFNGQLYFTIQNKSNLYTSLYHSNGTLEGTEPVFTFGEYLVSGLFSTNADLFVTATANGLGSELYRVLIDEQDIELMKDINPGSEYGYISNVMSVDNLLFFSALSPDYGYELWQSNGTPQGTNVIDLIPGSEGSNPKDLYYSNGKLFLSAIQPGMGQELWVIENIITSTKEKTIQPGQFTLSQNYPNPFNPTTIINYELGITNYVKLIVYDVLGREVKTLINKKQQAGNYQMTFDASGLASGIYYYQLIAEDYVQTRKMLLLR